MSVGSGVPYNAYTGNGLSTVFAYGFTLLAAADLVVTIDGVVTSAYTVSGIGVAAGGSITFSSAPANGIAVLLRRVIQLLRSTEYQNNGDLQAETVNDDFDRLWTAVQQVNGDSVRALRAPELAGVDDIPAAATRASRLLAFDATGAPEESPFTVTQVASAVAAAYTGMGTADAAAFIAAGTGAVARTMQDKAREFVSVKDFGAVGDGVTDDTLAIEKACNALIGNQTLYFPDGIYLVSFVWPAKSDSDTVDGIGRGRGVCYVNGKQGIRLYGPKATIKCVNHNIATNGGMLFALFRKSPGCSVEGFNFDMTFTGYNTLAAYYPLCGGVAAADKYAGAGNQDTLCSDFAARGLTFKLYHPNGAFAITGAPYGGTDYNNGFKIISVLASGDSAATAYSEQSRGLTIENIRFKKGHNGYGCWGISYNDATFKDIHAEAWVAASYTIAGGTYSGVSFVAPVRFYQYYSNGLTIDNITVLSLPWAERVGAFVGRCGGVSIDSGLADRYSGGAVVSNSTFVLDDDNAALGPVFDVGIKSSLSGHVRLSNNSFHAWGDAGVVSIYAEGGGGTGRADYSITNNIASKAICGPFLQVVNGNDTSDAARLIKSVTVSGNVISGWGSEGAIYTYRVGTTYYGVEHLIATDNIIDGSASVSASGGNAIDVRGRTSADNLIVTHNIIKGASSPVQEGSATSILADNIYTGNASNGSAVNYLTNNQIVLTTFAATAAVTWTIAAEEYFEYYYIEYSATNTVVTILSGVANSGTGTIRTVGAGNTGKLTYKKIGNIK